MCVLLITRLLWLVGRWALKPIYHTSWVALVTPTDRPKSVRNRCLIELFCGVVCVVTCPFDISVGVGAFVIGLGQISSFLSPKEHPKSVRDYCAMKHICIVFLLLYLCIVCRLGEFVIRLHQIASLFSLDNMAKPDHWRNKVLIELFIFANSHEQ